MPEFAGDVTLCRSGSQGKTIARLHPVVSEFLAADLWHTALRSYAIFPHFSPCYSSVVLWMGISTAEIPRAMLSDWVAEQDSKLKQLKRAVFVGYMGLFFGYLFLLELAFGLVHSAN
jgi:hypothetical protein